MAERKPIPDQVLAVWKADLVMISAALDAHDDAELQGIPVPRPKNGESERWHPGIFGPITLGMMAKDLALALLGEVERLKAAPTGEEAEGR